MSISTTGSSGAPPPIEPPSGPPTGPPTGTPTGTPSGEPTDTTTDDSTPTSAASTGASWHWLFWAAVAIVVVYVVFAVFAFARADNQLAEIEWSRSVYVLLGVEAIAFTAVGWLFGREVHRGEAQTAKQNAAQAKADVKEQRSKVEDAKEREADARERATAAETKGRALADAVRASTGGLPPIGGNERSGDREAPLPGGGPTADPLRNLADSLFPPA